MARTGEFGPTSFPLSCTASPTGEVVPTGGPATLSHPPVEHRVINRWSMDPLGQSCPLPPRTRGENTVNPSPSIMASRGHCCMGPVTVLLLSPARCARSTERSSLPAKSEHVANPPQSLAPPSLEYLGNLSVMRSTTHLIDPLRHSHNPVAAATGGRVWRPPLVNLGLPPTVLSKFCPGASLGQWKASFGRATHESPPTPP